MKNFIYLAISFLLFSCSNESSSIDTTHIPQSENASFIEKIDNQTILNNRYFKQFPLNEGIIILEVNQKEVIAQYNEFSSSVMTISPIEDNKTWSIKTKAHEMYLRNNTLFTKSIADYDHEDTYTLFNVETGALLLNYTYSVLTARIPESNFKRYIGYTSRQNTGDLLKNEKEDVIGILTYASENKSIQTIKIKAKKEVNNSTPTMDLVAFSENERLFENDQLLYFWELDENYTKEDIHFAFGLTFYVGENSDETAILFEIVNDNIVLSNSKYDTNIFMLTKD